jgi:putative transcriptional regulator
MLPGVKSELAPGFLIAVPQLEDRNFSRSVVLLVEHSEDGAMGLIFNHPGGVFLSDVGRAHGINVNRSAKTAYQGGPVQQDRGFLLHRRDDVPESVRVAEGIWLSVSTESLRPLLEGDPSQYRLCLGYAGWGPGQLEREVMVGGWLAGQCTAQRVFETPPEKVWDLAIRDLGVDPAFLVPSGGTQ